MSKKHRVPARRRLCAITEALETRRLLALTILTGPQAEVTTPFVVGASQADPTRHLVYLLDQTNNKVQAIDTDAGRTSAHASVSGRPTSLAISPDDSELYVVSNAANRIDVYSLPELNPVRSLDVPRANRIAAGAGGVLYVSGSSTWNPIRQVSAIDGTVLRSFGNYYAPVLATDSTGNRLFVSESGLSTTGTDEYDVANPAVTPPATHHWLTEMFYGKEAILDEQYNRLYSASNGGTFSLDLATQKGAYLAMGGVPTGLALAAGQPYLWVSSDTAYEGVYRYDRPTGALQGYYKTIGTRIAVSDVSATTNGNFVYSGFKMIGIVGSPTLSVTSVPVARFVATAGTAPSGLVAFDASGSQDYEPTGSINAWNWSFGDGATASGVKPTHLYASPGRYTVTLTVTDDQGNQDDYTTTLNVNAAPVAQAQSIQTQEETPVQFSASATDPDGDAVTYSIASQPAHGAVTYALGKFTYLPAKDFFGADSFTFAASDGVHSDVATISIAVTNINDAPRAAEDILQVASISDPTEVLPLGNDWDPDGDSLTLLSFTQPAAGKGTVARSGNVLVYTPASPFTAPATFTYTIGDGAGLTSTATVALVTQTASLSGDWGTVGNSPAHTGYFPGTIGSAEAVQSWTLPTGSMVSVPVTIADGRVYVSRVSGTQQMSLDAYDAQSGQLLWSHALPGGYSLSQATYFNGRVYVQRCNHSSDSQLWALDAATGKALWSAPFLAQYALYSAPSVSPNGVWIYGGTYGGMYGFTLDGAPIANLSFSSDSPLSPSQLDGYVYSFNAGKFIKYASDGSVIWTLNRGTGSAGGSSLANGRAFLAGVSEFYAVDLATGNVLWSVPGNNFNGSAAVQGDTVFIATDTMVKAYSVTDGSLRMSYATNDYSLWRAPVVTDDALIISASSKTYIFSKSTGALLTTLPVGGTLSLANNRLYICGNVVRTFAFGSTPFLAAGGPYAADEASGISFTAQATGGVSAAAYQWDLDYDGATFNADATGLQVSTAPFSFDGPSNRVIAVRATDTRSNVIGFATTSLAVANTPPMATLEAGPSVLETAPSTVTFVDITDSIADVAAGLIFSYDFNNDGDFDDAGDIASSSSTSASYTFPVAGNYVVHGRITDKDGGFSDYTTTVTVRAPAPPPTVRSARSPADAYVADGGSANTNFGTKTELDVRKSATTGSNRESFLRFPLTGGAAASVIDAAHLRLFTRISAAGSVQLDLYAVSNTTWSETAIKWSNKPASTGSILASKTVSSTSGAWLDFDVSNYVKQQRAAGATAVSFVLRGHATSTPYAIIASDEATANRPALQLTEHIAPAVLLSGTTATVPEGGSSSTLTARLSIQPATPVTVTISRTSGDVDLSAPATLTFTPFNWNVAQPITLSAADDADLTSGTAAFKLTADSGYGTASFTATEKENDLRPTADSYVRDGTSAGSNFGTATSLQVRRSTTAGNTRWTVLKFDLTALTTIASATLRLNGKLDVTTNPSVTVQAFAASSTSWSETGVTWNNKPSASGAALGQIVVSGTTAKWYTIDLTAWLQSQKAAGKTSVALVLTSPVATTSMAVFSSDEATTSGPQLMIAGR